MSALGLALGGAVLAQEPALTRSVRDGVYTSAQAARGLAVYEEKCTSCHASRMWGSDWPDKSLFALYDTISNYMPQDDPGSLGAGPARDVMAYILKMNKLPAGTKELPEAPDDLKQIRIELPAP